MTPTQTLKLLRQEIARRLEYQAEQYAASKGGDGGILYHGGALDTLRDLQKIVGEPKTARPKR
jgi:hypothetical protein